MDVGKLSVQNLNYYAPRFEIKIKNNKLPPELANSISSVKVVETLSEGSSFTLQVSDEFDMNKQKFVWLDHDLLKVGNPIEINLGYGSNLLKMITGKITKLNPSFFTGQPPTIEISGMDTSYDSLKRPATEKTYTNMSYSDIAQDIAKKSGLKATTEKTPKVKEPVCRKNDETNLNFLKTLAKGAQFSVWIDRQTQALCFKKPGDNKKEIMTLELGKDLISFSPVINTAYLVSEVEVRSHNPQDPSKPIIGKAKAGSEQAQESGKQQASQVAKKVHKAPKRVITDRLVHSKAEADAIAKAELNKASDTFITGDVSCVGLPQIRPGICIKLDKVGKIFSGKYYVTKTTHTANNSGYQTTFGVKRNAA